MGGHHRDPGSHTTHLRRASPAVIPEVLPRGSLQEFAVALRKEPRGLYSGIRRSIIGFVPGYTLRNLPPNKAPEFRHTIEDQSQDITGRSGVPWSPSR